MINIITKLRKKLVVCTAVCAALVLCVGLMTALTPNPQENEKKPIPILMYHSLLKDSARWNDYVIPPDDFESDLKFLTENGYTTVFVSEVVNYVLNGAELPEKPVVITFDDGYYNNYSYAFELLKKYNCKAVISPIGSCTQKFSETVDISPTYGHCSWEQLKEMTDSGLVEIQNHSWDLHSTSGRKGVSKKKNESAEEYINSVKPDIEKAQEQIFANLGTKPLCFVYPFGAYTSESEQLIRSLCFACSLSCTEKIDTVERGNPESLYALGRFLRSNKRSAEIILKE